VSIQHALQNQIEDSKKYQVCFNERKQFEGISDKIIYLIKIDSQKKE
jgi:hypothetical protein